MINPLSPRSVLANRNTLQANHEFPAAKEDLTRSIYHQLREPDQQWSRRILCLSNLRENGPGQETLVSRSEGLLAAGLQVQLWSLHCRWSIETIRCCDGSVSPPGIRYRFSYSEWFMAKKYAAYIGQVFFSRLRSSLQTVVIIAIV